MGLPWGRRNWVFDLDGTLTRSIHDFAWIRSELGLPEGVGILEALAALPPEEAARKHTVLADWEMSIAERAEAEPDAVRLVEALVARGARLGIFTRNGREITARTLEVAGLAAHFPPAARITRDCGPPKPLPDGLLDLLGRWGVSAADSVMLGDWHYDIDAGRAAGCKTVLVDRDDGRYPWAERADVVVRRLDALLEGG